MTAAAIGLTADASSVAMITTVVTHAANRGPRTSTWSGALVFVLVDTDVLLLHEKGWAGGETTKGRSRVRRERKARLLSSYNNNSNNPRRGTDRLRGAW